MLEQLMNLIINSSFWSLSKTLDFKHDFKTERKIESEYSETNEEYHNLKNWIFVKLDNEDI